MIDALDATLTVLVALGVLIIYASSKVNHPDLHMLDNLLGTILICIAVLCWILV